MLSDDQNDQPERTESGVTTPEAGQPTAPPATPVVTRRTRKAPAKQRGAARHTSRMAACAMLLSASMRTLWKGSPCRQLDRNAKETPEAGSAQQ